MNELGVALNILAIPFLIRALYLLDWRHDWKGACWWGAVGIGVLLIGITVSTV